VHLRLPHFEYRNRLTTSCSGGCHPQIFARICGSARRSWPQAMQGQNQGVLIELVTEYFDFELASHHADDCAKGIEIASIQCRRLATTVWVCT
jgi:hypothetical protein